ncbi:hypothetical protein ACFUEJ_08290 [Gordonia sp. NPDC057258]|uniref:hypothetical protein n=1 Tax=unclassified Gordonia (in: high G+C Gram-positive bacteria) TaxID=2657482 RepID=UPI0036420CCE
MPASLLTCTAVTSKIRGYPTVESGTARMDGSRAWSPRTDLPDRLAENGVATREYRIFDSEWWLYVLNRIAEDPTRVFHAIVDLGR